MQHLISASSLLQYLLFLCVVTALAKPTGGHLARVLGETPPFYRLLGPVEQLVFRLIGP